MRSSLIFQIQVSQYILFLYFLIPKMNMRKWPKIICNFKGVHRNGSLEENLGGYYSGNEEGIRKKWGPSKEGSIKQFSLPSHFSQLLSLPFESRKISRVKIEVNLTTGNKNPGVKSLNKKTPAAKIKISRRNQKIIRF